MNVGSGNVGIGTSSPNTKLHVVGGENDGSTAALKVTNGSQNMLFDGNEIDVTLSGLYLNNNSDLKVIIANGGGNVGIGTASPDYKLHVNGDIAYTGSIHDVSDIRLKENIVPLENAIEKVSSINSIYFNNKGESEEMREVGVIAQEVEKVLPEVVSENAEGYKSVDYTKLTPLLIEAVKEQQKVIEALNKRIEKLEQSIAPEVSIVTLAVLNETPVAVTALKLTELPVPTS